MWIKDPGSDTLINLEIPAKIILQENTILIVRNGVTETLTYVDNNQAHTRFLVIQDTLIVVGQD